MRNLGVDLSGRDIEQRSALAADLQAGSGQVDGNAAVGVDDGLQCPRSGEILSEDGNDGVGGDAVYGGVPVASTTPPAEMLGAGAGVKRRMRWLPVSAMYRLPEPSTATPAGLLSRAAVAVPPSPL